MNQTIRVKQITIRVPRTQAPESAAMRGGELARRVAEQVARRSGRAVPAAVQTALASRLSGAAEKR